MAAAVMAVGLILDAGGLVKGAATQSLLTQHVITVLLVVGPILLLAMGIWISFGFKLTKKTHAVLMREIARFKQGETAPAAPEDKAIVEDLTGWPYEKLWGKNNVARRVEPASPV
jgi:oligogalacturonide transporter